MLTNALNSLCYLLQVYISTFGSPTTAQDILSKAFSSVKVKWMKSNPITFSVLLFYLKYPNTFEGLFLKFYMNYSHLFTVRSY